jgi:hypothetical protein
MISMFSFPFKRCISCFLSYLLHFLIIVVLLLFYFISKAQCVSSGSYKGSTFVNDNLIGNVVFSNPANALNQDGIRAVASVNMSLLGSAQTNYLEVTDFGFSIPASATICGITAEVRKKATGINVSNYVTDNRVKLVVNGAVSGSDKSKNTHWTTSDVTETYGSSSDLWGLTLTPAKVNSSNFGIAISADFTGLIGVGLSAEIDQIVLTVYYNSATVLPVKLISFTADAVNNQTKLKWETAGEEDNSYIILQRSANANNWDNIYEQALHNSTGNHSYQFLDKLNLHGSYFYRLQLVSAAGGKTYSPVRKVSFGNNSVVNLFPNPFASWVTVENSNPTHNIILMNLMQQQISVPERRIAGNSIQLDVRNLTKGIYFLKSGTAIFKLVKN